MDLCVNARQDREYISYAKEILFEYRDRKAIPDYMEKYPDKTMILLCTEEIIDWDTIQTYSILNEGRLICKIYNPYYGYICKKLGLKFFFGYPIRSYDELRTVLDMGVEYVRLGAPLFFDLDHINKFFPQAKIRIVPNRAYSDVYEHEDGIAGTWIRPEDIMFYKDYAAVIEFENVEISQEQALIRIYWTERAWPGEIELIIPDIKSKAVNRMIHSDITEKRLNCRQVCKQSGTCHICYRLFDVANPDLVLAYKEAVIPKYEALKEED